MEGVEGKIALITGGTAGVGFQAARLLAQGGATVIVNGRSEESAQKALGELGKISPETSFLAGDASDYDSIKGVAGQVLDKHGRLDILFSAGASSKPGPMPFEEMSRQDLIDGICTRIFPRMFPIHACIPALRESEAASVVMLTTDAARHATPGETTVGASGAAVMMLTKSLAKEFTRWGCRVNSVAMTITSGTPSWDRIFGSESFQNRLFTKAVSKFPFGRPPNAEEVARMAVFLASDQALQITGQTVSVNGGLSFGGW